jgi:probable addiction module antidote protein
MTALRTRPYDSANYLRSEEAIAVYLADALASGDDTFFQHALQVAARARGMSEVAAASGLGRESLYKALAPGAQPRFSTVRKVMGALGVTMTIAAVKPRAKSAGAPRKALAAKTAARKPERAKGRA